MIHRRIAALAVTLLVSTLVGGCADAPTAMMPRDAGLRRELLRLGFGANSIVELDDRFVVEGDIVILKDDLRKHSHAAQEPDNPAIRAPRPTLQWLNGGGKVNPTTAQSIRVNLSALGTNDAGWAAATRTALSEWSTINGVGISMAEASSAHITVQFTSNPFFDCGTTKPVVACANLAVGGAPGAKIYINRAYDTYSASQKVLIMVHEFGHTLGLRHSNWQTEGESQLGASLISTTPSTDPWSVMNGSTGGYPWSGFSFYDVRAASVLYPPPAMALTYSASNSRVTWDGSGDPPGTTYAVEYDSCFGTVDQEGMPTFTCFTAAKQSGLTSTYFDVTDPYTGLDGCGNEFFVWASLPNGAQRAGFMFTPTCGN